MEGGACQPLTGINRHCQAHKCHDRRVDKCDVGEEEIEGLLPLVGLEHAEELAAAIVLRVGALARGASDTRARAVLLAIYTRGLDRADEGRRSERMLGGWEEAALNEGVEHGLHHRGQRRARHVEQHLRVSREAHAR